MQVDLDDITYVSETTLTIRGSRRRTTVPKDIVDRLKLSDGDRSSSFVSSPHPDLLCNSCSGPGVGFCPLPPVVV